MVIEQSAIDEIRDMFLRLQNGTPLNSQQRRNAMGSRIGNSARDLSGLSFFTASVNFDDNDSKHRLVASQMLQLELKGKIFSCTSQQLDRLYQQYRTVNVDRGVVTKARRVLNILRQIFPDQNQHLSQNYALTLYWLISRILDNYNLNERDYPRIRDNFVNLDIARVEAMLRNYNQDGDEKFQELTLAMSRGNAGVDGISIRHDIVGQFLFDGVQLEERPELDPQRNFSHEEKLILYHRAQGRCQLEHNGKICGREIPFEDAVVDHIVPHSLGGHTKLSNGRIVFRSCNIARGNRDDFDPETQCKLIPDGD